MKKHCCERMDMHTGKMCDEHDNPFECPDYVIFYSLKHDDYGLIIHDGGPSVYPIAYCPFCGKKLPESKADKWFKELQDLGYEFDDENIPEKYKDDSWYKTT